jgi:hypothetical protein
VVEKRILLQWRISGTNMKSEAGNTVDVVMVERDLDL